MLARYDISCRQGQSRNYPAQPASRQSSASRAKYKEAVEACDSMDYIEYNVSQVARRFGLGGTNLGKQLRRHYPGVIERREEVRKRLGLSDNLPRGTRQVCKERYAEAVKLLRANRYITVCEAARAATYPRPDWSSICCSTTKSSWTSVSRFGERRSDNSAKAK